MPARAEAPARSDASSDAARRSSSGTVPGLRPRAAEGSHASRLAISRTFSGWRHVGDLDGGYSLFETSGGLVVLDRRAGAERVWFERLLAQYHEGHVACQRLLLPVPLEVDAIAAAALNERLEFLRAHALEIEPFGREFFRIEGVPAWLEPGDAENFVRDILGLIRAGRISGRDLNHAREELARMAAARAANATLTLAGEALETLVGELLRCGTPHTSPAGRPTFIEIAAGELARRFHKTQTASAPDLA
jgi:DNA mismatch repair protein MutL